MRAQIVCEEREMRVLSLGRDVLGALGELTQDLHG